jgi:hypothetical protein
MSKPTHQDALVYLQYLQWLKTTDFEEAADYVWEDDFPLTLEKFEEKFKEEPKVQHYTTIYGTAYEMLGAFHKHGLIHQDLLFDIRYFQNIWERFGEIILGWREKYDPGFMVCFEQMVKAEKKARGG